MPLEWLAYAGVGAVAGLLAGLFGVGGGLVIVPVLSAVFLARGVAPEAVVHLAVGTSLATIVFTAISSTRAHHRRGAVDWPAAITLAPGIMLGALLGALVAEGLGSAGLRLVFVAFEFAVATQLLLDWRPLGGHRFRPNPWAGGIIGLISAVVGVGGGTLSVPFLLWCGRNAHQAVATAAALGLPIAWFGAMGFIATGWRAPDLPAYSLGYVYLPALVGIVMVSMLVAPLGAWLAHRLPAARLRRLFGGILVLLGLHMLLSQ